MRLSLISFLLLLIFNTTNAQITKGNWLVGGSGSFSTSENPKTTNIQFNPNLGYFFSNNFAMGIKLDIESQSEAYYLSYVGSSLKIKKFLSGLFARYYFLNEQKVVNIFSEANFTYGTYNSTGVYTVSDGKLSKYSLSAGPAIFFNSSVAMELVIGYYAINDITAQQNNSGIQIGVGFQIHLKK